MSDGAVTVVVAGVVQIVVLIVGFLTLWVKLRFDSNKVEEVSKKTEVVERKLDNNTALTKAGTEAAAKSAIVAVESAARAQIATESMAETLTSKLNGGIDSAIAAAVDPLKETFVTNTRFEEFVAYIRQRNHDVLNAIAVQSNKIALLTEMMKQQQGKK